MKWLVDEFGQVVGAAFGEPPQNLAAVEGVEASDRDLVYFNGESVVFRPEKPEGTVWDFEANDWVVPGAPLGAITPGIQWFEFRIGTLLHPGFLRVTSNAHPLLASALASEINKDNPYLPAIAQVWEQIYQGAAEPFTTEELEQLNDIAIAANAPIRWTDGLITLG